jgi:signal transduction histidine kinase
MVVDDVLDLTRATARNEVQLQNMVPVDLEVFGDTGRIIQILNNLTGNSAKFTRKGFIRVVARGTGNGMVAVSVLDSGIGIPKSHLSSVFQPFEQVDMSISRKYGGFGLGLHITQDLVRAHGGDIYVTSQEGQGSCFTFTLPAVDDGGNASSDGRTTSPIAFDPAPPPSPRPSNVVMPPEESACARCLTLQPAGAAACPIRLDAQKTN